VAYVPTVKAESGGTVTRPAGHSRRWPETESIVGALCAHQSLPAALQPALRTAGR
jgi:hypothetical protein